jgi:hypothetical protein
VVLRNCNQSSPAVSLVWFDGDFVFLAPFFTIGGEEITALPSRGRQTTDRHSP